MYFLFYIAHNPAFLQFPSRAQEDPQHFIAQFEQQTNIKEKLLPKKLQISR